MRLLSRQRVVALAAVGMLSLAACGGGTTDVADPNAGATTTPPGGDQTEPPDEPAPTGGSFSVQIGEPSFLAPGSQCYESECSQVLGTIFAGLLSIDPKTNEQILNVAESIEGSQGSKVWTVKLKEGWKFHNGEPVDAESYIRAWNYSAYGPNATQTGFFFSPVEGYEDLQVPEDAPKGTEPKATELTGLKALDDHTIEITLSKPFSQWPLVMSYTPAFAPLAKECLEDLKTCREQPIGNGPYELVKWEHNKSITVKRFEDYQGDPGQADEILFKIYADPATAFRDWQAGEVDIVSPDPTQVPAARAEAGENVVQVSSGSFNYLGFPLYEEEFQDVRIRRALSMAIDRETIADKVYNGLVQPAQDVIAPFVQGSRTDACGEVCTYNPQKAKQLYEAAGGLPGDTITIWFNNDGGHEQWIQAVGNGWRTVLGLDYELESQPFTPYLETLDTREEVDGPYRLGWLPDYPSPENYLDPLYGEGSSNYGKWSGPAQENFIDLVAKGDAAPTIEEGVDFYQQAADVILEELPVIPLWFGEAFIVYSENVGNVQYDPLLQIPLERVTVNQ